MGRTGSARAQPPSPRAGRDLVRLGRRAVDRGAKRLERIGVCAPQKVCEGRVATVGEHPSTDVCVAFTWTPAQDPLVLAHCEAELPAGANERGARTGGQGQAERKRLDTSPS